MSWVIIDTKNDGYPINTEFPTTYYNTWSAPAPYGWIEQPDFNDGYPFRHIWFPESSGISGEGGKIDIGGDVKDSGDLTNTYKLRYGTTTNKQYVMSIQDLRTLQGYINGTLIPSNPSLIANFAGTNPQEYIVSVQMYPFTLPKTAAKEHIIIGSIDTNIESYVLLPSVNTLLLPTSINDMVTYDFGEIDIPKYGDFRDFDVKIILQLPFIGSFDLDAAMWAGQTIGLRYVIDFNTGKISAIIKRKNADCNLDIECYSGTISATMPLFASNMGQYQNTLASLEYSIEQSKIKQISSGINSFVGLGATFAGGTGVAGAIGSLVGVSGSLYGEQAHQQYLEYQLDHTKPHVSSISVASPLNAFFMDDRARIILCKPVFMQNFNPTIYGQIVGYACCYQSIVRDNNGLIVCSDIRCDGLSGATSDEITAIKQAFTSGVVV